MPCDRVADLTRPALAPGPAGASESPPTLLDVLGLVCELATSAQPAARHRARALLRQFPHLPAADWIADHLDSS